MKKMVKRQWIRKAKNGLNVIFIHGINSSEQCWEHDNGSYWPDLLEAESDLTEVGIYVFTYRTGVNTGHYGLGDVVDSLKELFNVDDDLRGSEAIIFVSHSMGGIVARRFLVNQQVNLIERDLCRIGLFLIASPSLGSEYANMISLVSAMMDHSQARALRFSQSNEWLNDLNNDFVRLKESSQIQIQGKELVEDLPLYGKGWFKKPKPIVEPFSAARYFGDPYKVPGSDHISIAKPADENAIQHRLLVKFIKDFMEGKPNPPGPSKNSAYLNIYRQLALSCRIHDSIGYLPDIDSLLTEVKHVFHNPVIISVKDSVEMIQEAERQIQNFDSPKTGDDEWENDFDLVKLTLQPIIEVLPSRSECLNRILQIPKDILASFLVNDFYGTKDPKARCLILQLVEIANLGREASIVLEDFVKSGWSKSIYVQQAVRIAQRTFGEEFDNWYKGIRGIGFEEERTRVETQYDEAEAQRREKREENHKRSLEDFKPKNNVLPQQLSPEQVPLPLLYEKIQRAVDELKSMQKNNDHRRDDIHNIAYTMKYLLRPFFPNSAFHIHEIDITYTEKYATSMLITELETILLQLEINYSEDIIYSQ